MSKSTTDKPLVIEGYKVYCNQDSNTDTSTKKSMDGAFSVKPEPIDTEYEHMHSQGSSPAGQAPRRSERPRSEKGNLTFGKSKSQIRDVMSKSKEHGGPKLRNVVDSLLQKNELLLAQNDAVIYKPNARASNRYSYDAKKMEGGLGETTFLVSQQSQARITKTQDSEQDVVSGRLLRPRSPTRKLVLPERDKTHLNTAIMESKVQDKESDKFFRVQKHDLVSAVSCQAMFSSKGGKIAANIDLTYYWCNFCSYSSTSKHALLNHITEHRFTCKHCKYQSFSRADVIRHASKTHEEFTCMATSLKYCSLLSDFLQVNKQSSDDKKRKADYEDDETSVSKVAKMDDDTEDSTASSNSQVDKPSTDDYEFFDMEVEEIEENNDHGIVTEEMPDLPEHPPVLQIPNIYSSRNKHKMSAYNPIQSDQDLLYQQYASQGTAMQILPTLDDDNHATVQTVTTPSRTINTNNKPIKPKLVPKFAQQKTTPPAKPTVSSSLYWSCGYCSFKSDSQWKIKHHSVSKHPGKPHRYVALILPAGQTNLNEEEDDGKDVTVDLAEESDDSNSNQSSGSMNGKQTAKKSGNGLWKVNLK